MNPGILPNEVRYAIIVGLDDYVSKPLSCCVNDAKSIAEILEKKCLFVKENIELITSTKTTPNKELYGTLEHAFDKIKQKFVANQDSILFYFAGHGYKNQSESVLLFHDLEVKIADLFMKFNGLSPRFQMYIIDACEAGGKVLTRSPHAEKDLIEDLINQATGILFMYASTDEETVDEDSSLGHGIFTHFLLKVLTDDANYRDGVLSPNILHDRIAFETQKSTKFKQNPVIENRSEGFYPFAFLESSFSTKGIENSQSMTRGSSTMQTPTSNFQSFPYVNIDLARTALSVLSESLDRNLEDLRVEFQSEYFEIIVDDNFDSLGNYYQKVVESIVKNSRIEKIEAIEDSFFDERVEMYNPFGGSGFISSFLKESSKNHYTRNDIRWNSGYVKGKSLLLKSKSISSPDCGIAIVVYRAKYGIGYGFVSFRTYWSGTDEKLSKISQVQIAGYKLDTGTVAKIDNRIATNVSHFKTDVLKWRKERQKEIDEAESRYI